MQTDDTHAGTTPAPTRTAAWSRRGPRGLLWLAGIAIVVAVLESIGWPFLRVPVEAGLRQALQREVSISPPFAIRFIGHLRLRADAFVVGPPPEGSAAGGDQPDLLRATNLRLSVPYTTLISLLADADEGDEGDASPSKRLHIGRLEVKQLAATLLRSAEGQANWRFGAQEKTVDAPLTLPEFDHLALEQGELRIDDALKRIHIEAAVRAHEGSTHADSTAGTSGLDVNARGTYREQALTFRLRSSGLLKLAETGADAALAPVRLEVRVGASELDFEGKVRDLMHLAGLDGQFRLAGRSLSAVGAVVGVTLPTTAAFAMQGRLLKEESAWSAAISELVVGRSRLNGDFRYDPTLRVPKLTGKLGGARLALPDLGPAVGTENPARPGRDNANAGALERKASTGSSDVGSPAPNDVRILPQREFNIPSLAAMDADVTVALDEFDLGTAQLEKMAPLRAQLILDDRLLSLKDIVARTASGELRGALTLNARQQTPLWNADLRWSGVQLERFIKPRDVADRNSGYVSGTLGGRARLTGSGRSTAGVLATLDGDIQMWVSDGTISHFLVEVLGLDLAQALGVFVGGDARLPMRCAVAALAVRQGQATSQVAVIETSDSTLRATGLISFPDERFSLEFRAKPKDVSPISLRAPVFVEGTFSQPQVRIEKTALGLRVAAAAALATLTPLAGVLALIDLGEAEKSACLEAIERVQNGAQAPAAPPKPGQK